MLSCVVLAEESAGIIPHSRAHIFRTSLRGRCRYGGKISSRGPYAHIRVTTGGVCGVQLDGTRVHFAKLVKHLPSQTLLR